MFENVHEVILKVTKDCNLRCRYCYLPNKEQYAGQKMSVSLFKTLIDRFVLDKKKAGCRVDEIQLTIIFHGGEPTLVGIPLLEEFALYAKQHIPNVRFGIQTNMTLFSDEWAKFFLRWAITPGISIDGLANRDNVLRKDTLPWRRAYDIMKKNGVSIFPLIVVTQQNIRRLMAILHRVHWFFNKCVVKANFAENIYSPLSVFPEVSPKALLRFFYWPVLKDFLRGKNIIEENVAIIIKSFIYEQVGILSESGGHCCIKFCGGGNLLVEVDAEGVVCFCGRWDKNHDICIVGSLLAQQDLFGLNSLNKAKHLQQEKIKDMRRKGCDTCYARNICQYGCIAFAYAKYGRICIRDDLFCQFAKQLYHLLNKYKHWLIVRYAQEHDTVAITETKSEYIITFSLQMRKLPMITAGISFQRNGDTVSIVIHKKYCKKPVLWGSYV